MFINNVCFYKRIKLYIVCAGASSGKFHGKGDNILVLNTALLNENLTPISYVQNPNIATELF